MRCGAHRAVVRRMAAVGFQSAESAHSWRSAIERIQNDSAEVEFAMELVTCSEIWSGPREPARERLAVGEHVHAPRERTPHARDWSRPIWDTNRGCECVARRRSARSVVSPTFVPRAGQPAAEWRRSRETRRRCSKAARHRHAGHECCPWPPARLTSSDTGRARWGLLFAGAG